MTPATRVLLEALIRLGKGALSEFEKWLHAQDVRQSAEVSSGSSRRSAASPAFVAIDATRQPVADCPFNQSVTR